MRVGGMRDNMGVAMTAKHSSKHETMRFSEEHLAATQRAKC